MMKMVLAVSLACLLLPVVAFADTTSTTSTAQGASPFQLNVPIPGLQFATEFPETTANGKTTIAVPLFAQYVAAAYKYLSGIAVVAAAIMIVYGGFLYVVGGTIGTIDQGRHIITDAIIGLILLLGAYSILSIINPDLLTLNAIKITTIKPDPIRIQELQDDAASGGGITGGGEGLIGHPLCATLESCKTFCKQYCSFTCDGTKCTSTCKTDSITPDMAGLTVPKIVATTPFPADRKKTDVTTPGLHTLGQPGTEALRDALIKAGQLAAEQGYMIRVGSTYRPVSEQTWNACINITNGDAYTSIGDTAQADNYYKNFGFGNAAPGTSPHGTGNAIDLELWKDGHAIMFARDLDGQFDPQFEEPVKVLRGIMEGAGFVGIKQEIWHYEIGGTPGGNRCKPTECPWPPSICTPKHPCH